MIGVGALVLVGLTTDLHEYSRIMVGGLAGF